jgi:hypothetical protein
MPMRVIIHFVFPEVADVDSEEADNVIDELTIDLKRLGYTWYIEEACNDND